jgi:hypothetical protein
MLWSFQMRIAVYSNPDLSLALGIFLASIVSFWLGIVSEKLTRSYFKPPPGRATEYRVNLTRLRRVQRWLFAIATLILLVNLAAYGLPPVFRVWGQETLNYVEYGKLKQILNAVTMTLFLSASLEPAKRRRYFTYAFSLCCMMAYATRGFLLVMLMQGLFVFSLRTNARKRTLYWSATATLLIAAILSNMIGNSRAQITSEGFAAYFGIRDAYASWPMALLWIIAYISTPFSNLCWIIHSYRYTGPTLTFLGTLLPAFWSPVPLEAGYLGSPNIIDGVDTYIAKYFLDLSYFGIFFINYIWGIISGFLERGKRLAGNPLTSAVVLAAIAFIFFADFLTFLSIVMELAILGFIQRYVMRWADLNATRNPVT